VLFSVVVLLPLSGALLVVVVVVESVDFCVTSGDGAASAPGEVSVVVVVVVSFVVPWHPTIIVPAMKAKAVTAASETIYFEIFMGREYQNSMILHGLKPWATLIPGRSRYQDVERTSFVATPCLVAQCLARK
jgi:hypothetical protein